MHTHVYIHICIYVFIYIYISLHIYPCLNVCIYKYMYTYIYTCIYIDTFECISQQLSHMHRNSQKPLGKKKNIIFIYTQTQMQEIAAEKKSNGALLVENTAVKKLCSVATGHLEAARKALLESKAQVCICLHIWHMLAPEFAMSNYYSADSWEYVRHTHTHTHTCTHTHTHTRQTYTHICAHTRTHTRIRARARTHIHIHIHIYTRTLTHTHTRTQTHTHVMPDLWGAAAAKWWGKRSQNVIKWAMYLSKRDTWHSIWPQLISDGAKELEMFAKEPCISAKERCLCAKEPWEYDNARQQLKICV